MPIALDYTYEESDLGLIPMAVARAHLRVEADYPVEQISPYLAAAEDMAVAFLNRNVYRDQDALTAALLGVPDKLAAGATAYSTALVTADAITDLVVRAITSEGALTAYQSVQADARETYCGIVLTPGIVAGILLLLRHLFNNREEVIVGASMVTRLPVGAYNLLQPYRMQMGI